MNIDYWYFFQKVVYFTNIGKWRLPAVTTMNLIESRLAPEIKSRFVPLTLKEILPKKKLCSNLIDIIIDFLQEKYPVLMIDEVFVCNYILKRKRKEF